MVIFFPPFLNRSRVLKFKPVFRGATAMLKPWQDKALWLKIIVIIHILEEGANCASASPYNSEGCF